MQRKEQWQGAWQNVTARYIEPIAGVNVCVGEQSITILEKHFRPGKMVRGGTTWIVFLPPVHLISGTPAGTVIRMWRRLSAERLVWIKCVVAFSRGLCGDTNG